jgi:hypothetical protein
MKLLAILLTVLFIGLKLTDYVAWSWILVLSPLLIWIGYIVFLLFVLGICAFVANKFQ